MLALLLAALLVAPAMPLRVNIVGGGLAGMGVARACAARGAAVRVFDANGPPGAPGSASAAAAGILHPLSPRLRLTWRGAALFDSALAMLAEASAHTDASLVLSRTLLRPSLGTDAEDAAAAAANPEYLAHVPGRGVQIRGGLVVDVRGYLAASWAAIAATSAACEWVPGEAPPLASLREGPGDVLVVAAGASVASFAPSLVADGTVSLCRGQNLIVPGPWPDVALLRGKYAVPAAGGGTLLGATKEYTDDPALLSAPPDPAAAADELRDAAAALGVGDLSAAAAVAGVRVNPKRTGNGRLPLVGELAEGGLVVSGLGARGMLTHAGVGEYVAEAVLGGAMASVPEELRVGQFL